MHACAALLGLALFSLPTGWHRVKSQLRTKAALMLPKMSVPTQDPEEWSPAHTQGPTSTMTPFVHRKPDKPRSSGTQFGRDPGRAGTRTFPGTKSRNPPECTNMATRGTAPHVPRDGQGVLAPQVRPAPLGRNTLPNTLHFRSSTRHVCPPRGPLPRVSGRPSVPSRSAAPGHGDLCATLTPPSGVFPPPATGTYPPI